MYIETVPNRNSPPAILLRESYWDKNAKKSRKRTLANLSKLPDGLIEEIRACVKGNSARSLPEAFKVTASQPHGHVAAALGKLRDLRIEELIASRRSRNRDLVTAMITARILDPRVKLATARSLSPESGAGSLGDMLGLGKTDAAELYAAMDWLLERQERIETRLAGRHIAEGALMLWDLTSFQMEGTKCGPVVYRHSRDKKRGKMQAAFALLCDREGRPVAVEAFKGNVSDPATASTAIRRIRCRFGIERAVVIGDRGMLTEARIREDIKPAGLDWISALRAPAVRRLAENRTLRPSLFDERDLAEITCEELFPGERLVVCRNPLLAEERRRRRDELLNAAEARLRLIEAATGRASRPLKGTVAITRRVDKALDKHKMRKHFTVTIRDDGFTWIRNRENIAAEAALDGFYAVRTSLPETVMSADETVRSYKRLTKVEQAFRAVKTVDLKVRPVCCRLADRVRAHVLLCMLAYYVEQHMREDLKPILFDDEDPPARESAAAAAEPSPGAKRKAASKRASGGLPALSFRSLMKHLAGLSKMRIEPASEAAAEFDMFTAPTALQEKAFQLLGTRIR